jgi:hypothetical protein
MEKIIKRIHICLSPENEELIRQWADEGDRGVSAQISRLIRQEATRRQTSESGAEVRAA